MKKKISAGLAMWFAMAAWAAVDVNKATDAELDGLKGVGPSLSRRILDARTEAAFKDWPDFMSRVKGVKEKTAARLSAEGLTVNGKAFDSGAVAVAPAAAPPPATTARAPTPAIAKAAAPAPASRKIPAGADKSTAKP